MKPTARFALGLQRAQAQERPLRSRLIVDGRAVAIELFGWRLRYQAELDEGFLLITDYGGRGTPGTIVIHLLDHELHGLAWRSLGPLFSLFGSTLGQTSLHATTPLGPRTLVLTVSSGQRWKLMVRRHGIALLWPRLSLAAV